MRTQPVEPDAAAGPRPGRWALLAAAVLHGAQLARVLPRLPEPAAVHFDLAGRADGWSTPAELGVLWALLAAIVVGAFLALDLLLGRIPDAWIRLPHKEHWLAPPRRARTLRGIAEAMAWYGVATIGLLAGMLHLLELANRGGETSPRLPQVPFWALLGSYLVCTIVLLVVLGVRYRRPGPVS